MNYKTLPMTEEEESLVMKKIIEYADSMAGSAEHTEGNTIAAAAAGIDSNDAADIDRIWVDEASRGQGLGRRLLSETEREMKEKGSYVLLAGCCDRVSGFFF